MDEFINYLKNFKEFIGAIGVIGSVLNFWAKLQPKYAIPIGIVCALFILLWGIFERENGNSIIRALAWLGIVVAIAAEIFFVSIGVVILLRAPTDTGAVVLQTNEEFILNENRRETRISDVYRLKISRESTFVEIGIAPAPPDLENVEELEVTPQGDSNLTNQITELANKTSKLQTYYRLAEPTTDLSLDLLTVITLKQVKPVHIRVNCTYIDRDLLWEIRQWIFRNFSW